VRQGKARRVKAKARQHKESQGKGKAREGNARIGKVREGHARRRKDRQGEGEGKVWKQGKVRVEEEGKESKNWWPRSRRFIFLLATHRRSISRRAFFVQKEKIESK